MAPRLQHFLLSVVSCRLGVLPTELNRLLIIVVVLSMALTPLLNEIGRAAADYLETRLAATPGDHDVRDYQFPYPRVLANKSHIIADI